MSRQTARSPPARRARGPRRALDGTLTVEPAAAAAPESTRRSHAPRGRGRRAAPARGPRTPARGGRVRRGRQGGTPTSSCGVELTRPDVAIVDIKMPPTHTDEGLVAAQEIRRRIRASGCSCSPTTSSRAMRCGCSRIIPSASATCSRNASPTSPCSRTRFAARGRRVRHRPDDRLTAGQARRATGAARRAHGARARGARSDRRGTLERGIGERLFLSPKTVEAHVRQIFRKLG